MREIMAIDRFLSKIKVNGGSHCWEWQGCKTQKGYGQTQYGGKLVYTHRLSYEFFNNIIPEGRQVDHLCRNRKCVNPDHLEAVTHKENVLRGVGLTALNVKKTHCPLGHPYDLFNTYLKPNASRNCRKCGYEATARWENKHKKEVKETTVEENLESLAHKLKPTVIKEVSK